MMLPAISPAVVLFAHGARDANWRLPFDDLKARLSATLGETSPVELAFLEFMEPSLEAAIEGLLSSGVKSVHIVPVFLGEGGHVRRDLPAKLDALKKSHPGIQLTLHAAAGQDGRVLDAITDYALRCALPPAREKPLSS